MSASLGEAMPEGWLCAMTTALTWPRSKARQLCGGMTQRPDASPSTHSRPRRRSNASNPARSSVSRRSSNSGRSKWRATSSSDRDGTNPAGAEGSGFLPTGSNRVIAGPMSFGRAIPNVRLPRIGGFIGAFLLVPCPRAVRGLAMRGQKQEPVLSDSIHYELQYLDLMRRIWVEGDERVDRTGVGTRSLFGETMRFSLADDAIPLLTTKRVYWKTALREMLWFLTGDTNIRSLVAQGVKIWTDWPLDKYRRATGEAINAEDFEARIVADADFAAEWGDLGPVYGHQWVNWPRYEPAGEGVFRRAEQGHNQIAALIDSLRNNTGSRRPIFTGWTDEIGRAPGRERGVQYV